MIREVRKVARGWRWGRPAPRTARDPGPRVRTEASFDTEWAREPWARTARGVIQELVLLPAVRAITSPRVEGLERLHSVTPPVVVVANHASHLDTSVVIAALPAPWRDRLAIGAAADYFFGDAIRGRAAALAMGAFPVDRKRASAVSARLAVRLLAEGWSLVLFPEGGRSPDGWLQDVQPGAAFAATKTGRPVVPLWIDGTHRLLPKGAKRLRKGTVRITVGNPLRPHPDEKPRELNERITAAMHLLGREATTDWWTATRGGGPDPQGPEGSDWRRRWVRTAPRTRPRVNWP